MAMARPGLSAAGCSHCRSLVFNLFTSSTLRPTPVLRPSLPYRRAHVVSALPIRRFSSLPKPDNPTLDVEGEGAGRSVEGVPEDNSGTVATEESKAASVPADVPADVPWYLQVESPTHVASLEPSPLPETPPDCPPLIKALLEYASEEMGLDALSLLDLRKLDPPPALGPNLFMLFGTARSERHLTVSAGRLVRWLRYKHHVHADADGLLGPNERKIKLKRKAKRARLLGPMGTDDADDGIRTGWICVNLGTIDRGGAETAVVAEDGRASGFGVSQIGSTIVFQIMTEGRRTEMDLETLWTRALDRSLSPPSKPGSAQAQEDERPVSKTKSDSNLHSVERALIAGLHRPSGVSDSRRRQSPGALPSNQASFYSTWEQATPPTTNVDPLSTSSPEELARVLAYDAHQKQRLLELLRAQLDEMDTEAARAALAEPNHHQPSTPFMELMELAMATFPPPRTWEYRLAIQHKGSVSGAPGATRSLDNVRLLVEELRIYGIKATRQQYLQLLSCIFYAREPQSDDILDAALDVISTMHQRREPIKVSDLLVTIIEGASMGNNRGRWTRELIARIETLLYQPSSPCMDEGLLARLMSAHARQGNWTGVWRAWGVPARHLHPRSADMYIHMFQLATATRSMRICEQVLRRCIPESNSEDPPVLSNMGLRLAALECVQIADPRARELAEQIPVDSTGHLLRLATREFVKLTRLLTSRT
ncbi:putative ATPase synthesis protein mitochondrial protein [Rosellinia necatrix]|uniref:ATPase synthesis protein 25 n=1 Tax=Rosellinia necatrix TaxID=77044 RepID=A0A1W2TEE4_ROSNE|nr:putative ATPase synthesis protein mitochondrial protein [Rosellinia necatrix]